MSDVVIASIVAGVFSIIVTLIGIRATVKKSNHDMLAQFTKGQQDMLAEFAKQSELNDAKLDAKLERHQAVTDVKIEELTREVRAHNGFAQRLPVVERDIEELMHRMGRIEENK